MDKFPVFVNIFFKDGTDIWIITDLREAIRLFDAVNEDDPHMDDIDIATLPL